MIEIAALITSISVLVTAVVGGIKVLKEIKTVHKIVNSRTDELAARVEQLVIVLGKENIEVPDKPEKHRAAGNGEV